MSNKIRSKRLEKALSNRRVRYAGNKVSDTSATFDSMRAGRRLHGQGLAK